MISYKKAAFDSSDYLNLAENIAAKQNNRTSFEDIDHFKKNTVSLSKTIESLEIIESQKSIQGFSPLKPQKHAMPLAVVEEEEKNEMNFTVPGKQNLAFQKPQNTEENADQLALVLFQLKNEEQLEYKPKEKKKK